MVNLDSRKLEDILKFLIGLVVVFMLYNLSERAFFRLDLTEEKRYTITEPSKELLGGLDDVVFVEVFLEGDLPSGFKRFQRSIRETLEEFRVYAGQNIQYRFIDPLQAKGEQAQNEFIIQLNEQGIQPTNVFATEDGNRIEKLIFPGAMIYHGGQQTGVMLLKGNQGASAQEKLNQSIEGLEYELATAIRKLASPQRQSVGYVKGHGELSGIEIEGLRTVISEYYDWLEVRLSEERLNDLDALIIAKPNIAFSESEKYYLDQYLMRGGNVMFFLDKLKVNIDSIGGEGTVAVPYELNLDDQLFKYGIRINNTLVQDRQSAAYPVVVGNMGDQPQIRPMPWPYFPLINNYANHPVVKNLDATYLQFVNTLDTVKSTGISKMPLMFTSQYTRIVEAPYNVSLNEIRSGLEPELFNAGSQPVAYLLEGKFTSLYKNRFLPENVDASGYLEDGQPAKIVVVADGDFVKNAINRKSGRAYPLGYDPVSQATFANKDFVINGLSYLFDEQGLISARTKDIRIRPLDEVQVEEQRLLWQTVNIGLPIILVLIFGIIKYYVRKRKYTRF